eukprot:TRINITY_DN7036_c0_g1_i7.p1 TRINITY_DN7036_c0_g1~~TRINITY_DN7036_c0_g1_i7.p1  ORF type:complete len:752 (-),score=122.33 TRINITY_DN7036_c0_g1_i7:305-2290(-)
MDLLGFAFLHPLQPYIPSALNFTLPSNTSSLTTIEKPFFPFRGWHVHTQHLLELTHVLNGWGVQGPQDKQGWQDMLPDYQAFLIWLIANRQNRFQWIILSAEEWIDFANSTERQSRLQTLTSMAHSVGLLVGVDMPLALQQQHAMFMTTGKGTLQDQTKEIQASIDWVVQCGFDYMATESGFSEFTHPDDTMMLAWMNISTSYLYDKYQGRRMYIKCHCSTGQVASDYIDPTTGKPINFNFLPIFADERLGIYPHTVQYYRLDDVAPTYGNDNFTYMLDFMVREAPARDTIYYGESTYWVNYDIDLPLFLPVYADSRLYDLRLISSSGGGQHLQGQINFNSGWEWGYWLGDVVTARAAWNPYMNLDQQTALTTHLGNIARIFGPPQQSIVQIIEDVIQIQRDTFINGIVNGSTPANITSRNGQAYLQGWDTWSDIMTLADPHTSTQPVKEGFNDARLDHGPSYWKEIEPLLAEMEMRLFSSYNALIKLSPLVVPSSLPFFDEILDSLLVMCLRARQVHALYDYAASWDTPDRSKDWRQQRLSDAKYARLNATQIMLHRETLYRVPSSRIAGWYYNPTSYSYGYLWTVHSSYYWIRDEMQATHPIGNETSPCYMNIINPIDVAFGEGIYYNVTILLYEILEKFKWLGDITECLVAPEKEPHY